MTEPQSTETQTTEQPRKVWIAPILERTPLNEAMASINLGSTDATINYS